MTTLSKADQHVANYLNQSDIEKIQEFVNEKIISANKAFTAKGIYAELKNELSRKDLNENMFASSMSANVRGGYIVGIEGRRRIGYIKKDSPAIQKPKPEPKPEPEPKPKPKPEPEPKPKPEPEPKPKPEPEPKPEPKPEEIIESKQIKKPLSLPEKKPVGFRYRHIWINNNLYKMPMRVHKIHELFSYVLEMKSQENGNVVFDGKKFECENIPLLKRIITFHGGFFVGNSEPVLDDGSGIPVELRMPIH